MKYPTRDEFDAEPARGGQTVRQRLEASYTVDPKTGCWRWIRARTSSGYGHFHYRSAYYQAHRLMYGLYREPVTQPSIDHLCRTRGCVNPWHLEPVTHRENVRRGLGTYLTPEKVALIHEARRQRMSLRAIGRLFGVDHSTVARIVNGERWPEYAPGEAVA